MSEERDIVERLRMRPTILRKNPFGDIETDRAATKMFDDCHALMRQAADEIERLRAERDEARREVCFLVSESDVYNHISTSPEDVAEEYGWNCFNNHKPKE
jgi:hypothetical protein